MTEKELKRLSRRELLELLVSQYKKTERLQAKNERLEAELQERRIILSESGSIAEAALKLNGVFADAQKAAEQYLENLRIQSELAEKITADARLEAERMLVQAREQCEELKSNALNELEGKK